MNRWQELFVWSRKSPVWLWKEVCLQRERIGALLREFLLSFQTAKARRAGRESCFWERQTKGCQTRLTEEPHSPTADDIWLSNRKQVKPSAEWYTRPREMLLKTNRCIAARGVCVRANIKEEKNSQSASIWWLLGHHPKCLGWPGLSTSPGQNLLNAHATHRKPHLRWVRAWTLRMGIKHLKYQFFLFIKCHWKFYLYSYQIFLRRLVAASKSFLPTATLTWKHFPSLVSPQRREKKVYILYLSKSTTHLIPDDRLRFGIPHPFMSPCK